MKSHLSLIRTSNNKKYLTESKVRGFKIDSDEPQTIGGTGFAPSPIDLLNAALSSCTAMFLRNIASKESIDVGKISAKIKITRNEDKSFHFERKISFEKKINNTQKELLLKLSDKTPITRALKSSNKISTDIG
jgi:putative redox protein